MAPVMGLDTEKCLRQDSSTESPEKRFLTQVRAVTSKSLQSITDELMHIDEPVRARIRGGYKRIRRNSRKLKSRISKYCHWMALFRFNYPDHGIETQHDLIEVSKGNTGDLTAISKTPPNYNATHDNTNGSSTSTLADNIEIIEPIPHLSRTILGHVHPVNQFQKPEESSAHLDAPFTKKGHTSAQRCVHRCNWLRFHKSELRIPFKRTVEIWIKSAWLDRRPPQIPVSQLLDTRHDDPSLTKAFQAAFRLSVDHSMDFYSGEIVEWEELTEAQRCVFGTYFDNPQSAMSSPPELARHQVVTAVVTGILWDWANYGSLFRNFNLTSEARKIHSAVSEIHVSRERLSSLRRSKARMLRFEKAKRIQQRRVAERLIVLLKPFTLPERRLERLRRRSLEHLACSILNLKILIDVQGGGWKFQTFGWRNSQNTGSSELCGACAASGSPYPDSTVRALHWPGLKKEGDVGNNLVNQENSEVLCKAEFFEVEFYSGSGAGTKTSIVEL
ncbi:hypothetical protein BJ508DRAFT_335027 [Ascobolus immersus RN42]|uniref:Uncharacterized protein n=1 Tax=Ascobolus immersus RN42 TaxID=1160509 RepID=A0A3N4HFT4_ASCIM|nr:hypothetical protein BJ508DRAFT_335027 [Ascobolus immersus RN42]